MYGGTVVSCSIDRRAHVTVQPADRLELETRGERMVVATADDLMLRGDRFDVARCVLDYFRDDSLRCLISYASDIPI